VKIGDLVRFKKSHWDRDGFNYCGKWTGLIMQANPITIYWTTDYGDTVISDRRDDDLVLEVEVISENR
jgi:hypothetical protein